MLRLDEKVIVLMSFEEFEKLPYFLKIALNIHQSYPPILIKFYFQFSMSCR